MATTTQATTQVNKQYTLNMRDVLRGLLIAVVTAVITAVLEAIKQDGGFSAIEWGEVGVAAVSAGGAYLLKNLFTPTEIVVVNPPQQALTAIDQGAAIKVGTTTVAAKSNPSNTTIE
jgi:hypothetical protein